MRGVLSFFIGILFGSLVGASLALLLTPMSGEQMRSEIQARTKSFSDEVKLAAQTRREELEKHLAELRAPRRSSDIQVQ